MMVSQPSYSGGNAYGIIPGDKGDLLHGGSVGSDWQIDRSLYGPPPGNLYNEAIAANQARTNNQFPAWAVGKNVFLQNVLEEKLLTTDSEWIDALALGMIQTDAIHYMFKNTSFTSGLLGLVPEEGVANLLEMTSEQVRASSQRFGVSTRYEHGYMRTPEGRQFFVASLNHMSAMTKATMAYHGMRQILCQPTIYSALARQREFRISEARRVRRMFDMQCRFFAATQKPYQFETVCNQALKIFNNRDVVPTLLIVPPQTPELLRARAESRDVTIDGVLARYYGYDKKKPLTRKVDLYLSSQNMPMVEYKGVHEKEEIRSNILYRNRQVGQYFVMYGTCKDIEVIDHSLQTRVKIKYMDALKATGLFDRSTGYITEDGINVLFGEKAHGRNATWNDYLNSLSDGGNQYRASSTTGDIRQGTKRDYDSVPTGAKPDTYDAKAGKLAKMTDWGGALGITNYDFSNEGMKFQGPKLDKVKKNMAQFMDGNEVYKKYCVDEIKIGGTATSAADRFWTEVFRGYLEGAATDATLAGTRESGKKFFQAAHKLVMSGGASVPPPPGSGGGRVPSTPTPGYNGGGGGGSHHRTYVANDYTFAAKAFTQTNNSGDPLKSTISLMSAQTIIDAGKPVPLTLVLTRLLKFEMGAVTMMKGGDSTGMITYGLSNLTLGDDAPTKTGGVHFTTYVGAVVYAKKNVIVIPDQVCNGLVSGGETILQDYRDWTPDHEGENEEDAGSSMTVLVRPPNETVSGPVSITNTFSGTFEEFAPLDDIGARPSDDLKALGDRYRTWFEMGEAPRYLQHFNGYGGHGLEGLRVDETDTGFGGLPSHHNNSIFMQVRIYNVLLYFVYLGFTYIYPARTGYTMVL
jgi:hypothetical protein